MEQVHSRNSESMLSGGYIGKFKYMLDTDNINDDDASYIYLESLIDSILEKDHVCPNDITNRFNKLNGSGNPFFDGSILFVISPLAFADIFGLHGHDLTDVIISIVSSLVDEETQWLCIEYVHLLHDILWYKINKNDILEILPELDVLESEVICNGDDRNVFFAALWSFIFSDDFKSCYEKASNLKNTNSDIVGVACTIAGLYYGLHGEELEWEAQILKTLGYSENDFLKM